MSEEELKTQLKKEITSLCETNSSVMTYMECLMKRYEQLQTQLQQKENIIKEVREYILTHKLYCFKYDDEELFEITTDKKAKDELLKILDKES